MADTDRIAFARLQGDVFTFEQRTFVRDPLVQCTDAFEFLGDRDDPNRRVHSILKVGETCLNDLRVHANVTLFVPSGSRLKVKGDLLLAQGAEVQLNYAGGPLTPGAELRHPNEGRTTFCPAGPIPNLYVAPATTLVFQPNQGRAVYVLDVTLDADSILNNHNCVPVFIESVEADPTAEVINCSTTTPNREQVARDFQALGDALEEELPLEDMTGPNDQANANRRALLAQKLRLIAASIRAEEDEEAATQTADVLKKVDPAQDPKWLRDTDATNLVLLSLTLLAGELEALSE